MHKLLAAVTVLAVSTAQADIIYVDASCPGGDGSELDPYCSIQTAIVNAVDTDEIVVAPGTYFESINFLGKAITLRSSDGPEVTTIDGTGFLHVVQCVSDEGPDTILDGFTITGGIADGDFFPDISGGGMFNDNSSPTVTNCTFSNNLAVNGGGGMFNFLSSPTVTNCTFIGNTSDFVGGGMSNFQSDSTVTNCTFSGNSSRHGGGMHNGNGSSPTVTNCTFTGNSTTNFSGGGMITVGGSPTVTNCTFSGNSAPQGGGGMANFNTSSLTVTNCTFEGNTGNRGGGMQNNTNTDLRITNCTFSGNSAVEHGGGMSIFDTSILTVKNCTFAFNSAKNGNAIGFNFGASFMAMANCILWDGADGIWNNDGSTLFIHYTDVEGGFPGTGNIDSDPLFVDPDNGDFRLSAGSPCIDAGDNTAVPMRVVRDLDGNPRFVADACAGASGATVDMGAYEFQGTSCDLGTMLEMLAAWGSCRDCGICPADFDGDCSVGILDLLILLGNWG